MPARRKKFAANPEGVAEARQWFATADASTEGLADWDVKAQTAIEAILGVLASGCAIMLGTTMSGQAVSITIFDGDDKQRKYATDSIEFDDAMDVLWAATHKPSAPTQLGERRAAGD